MDLLEMLDNSENDSDFKFEDEDWYHSDSDTEIDIPDPNLLPDPLFQDVDKLPEPLKKDHFEEGFIYAMTESKDKNTMSLVLIIFVKEETFLFRLLSAKGTSRKTFHEGLKDQELQYSEVWRLAPRRELQRSTSPNTVRIGTTLRFEYEDAVTTARVTRFTSKFIYAIIECGKNRGKTREFEIVEVQKCYELFVSSLLPQLFQDLDDLKWENAMNTKTKSSPPHKPELKRDFRCPDSEVNKRL